MTSPPTSKRRRVFTLGFASSQGPKLKSIQISSGVHSHNVDNTEHCPVSYHSDTVASAAFKLFHDEPDGFTATFKFALPRLLCGPLHQHDFVRHWRLLQISEPLDGTVDERRQRYEARN
jgi:hypothetical protein